MKIMEGLHPIPVKHLLYGSQLLPVQTSSFVLHSAIPMVLLPTELKEDRLPPVPLTWTTFANSIVPEVWIPGMFQSISTSGSVTWCRAWEDMESFHRATIATPSEMLLTIH